MGAPTAAAEVVKPAAEAREIQAFSAGKWRRFSVDGLIVGRCLKKVLNESREEAWALIEINIFGASPAPKIESRYFIMDSNGPEFFSDQAHYTIR